MPESLTAREQILSRIRSSNTGVNVAARETEYAAIERAYQRTPSMDRETILRTFVERLHEYDAHVLETTSAEIARVIAEILKRNNQKSTVVAEAFPSQLLPEGFVWLHESQTTVLDLNTIEGAISACDVAISHTGTIIIKGARQITLLPDRYLCVVYEDQVVETVPEAMAALEKYAAEPLTFISGPSATADIEMTRIRGVHGPRFLDVILVRN